MDEGHPETGGAVVAGARVRVTGAAVRVGPVRPPDAHEPQVQVVREGDVIRAIQVVCTCGERIHIRCDY